MSKKLSKKLTFSKRDEFARKTVAEKIIKLLEADIDVSPMLIDGSWGTGKTEFCYKLINLIKEEHAGYLPIYVDAFRADHADEPLMTLLGAILAEFNKNEKKQKSFIKDALPILRFSLKTGLKAGIGWVLRQDSADLADDWDKDIKKAGDSIVDSGIERLLDDHIKVNDSIKTLAEALEKLAKEKSIILFIDELDRCRPDFAIAMLETIKHIFDVEGVQFVLVTNTKQLRASVNHCYGIAIDAQRYLDKFVGFSFVLPEDSLDTNNSKRINSEKHLKGLVLSSSYLKNSCLNENGHNVRYFILTLIRINHLSLREVETFIRYLELYQTLTTNFKLDNKMNSGYGFLIVFGVFLLSFRPNIAVRLTTVGLSYEIMPEILELLGKKNFHSVSVDKLDFTDAVLSMFYLDGIVLNPAPSDPNGKYASDFEVFPGFKNIPEDKRTKWEKVISSLFSGSDWDVNVGERVEIVIKAIKTLKLGD